VFGDVLHRDAVLERERIALRLHAGLGHTPKVPISELHEALFEGAEEHRELA